MKIVYKPNQIADSITGNYIPYDRSLNMVLALRTDKKLTETLTL